MIAKKKKGAEFLVHLARADKSKLKTYKRRASKVVVSDITDVFFLATTMDEVRQWMAEDRYGLLARGFQQVAVHRLTVMEQALYTSANGQAPVALPPCGAYEQARFVYRRDDGSDS